MRSMQMENDKIKNVLGDNIGFISLVDFPSQDVALKVVNSARISYSNSSEEFTEKDAKLCKFLWDNEHTSPFRHSFFTFHIKLPLFVARQWMKYQVGSCWRSFEIKGEEVRIEIFDHFYDEDKGCSWNEVSGRYVQFTPLFYIPKEFRGNPSHGNKQSSEKLNLSKEDSIMLQETMMASVRESFKNYQKLLDKGVAKEIARMILPQNLYTEVYWTVSLHGILHFLRQRLKPEAQYEIRQYAQAVKDLISPILNKIGVKL